MKRTLLKVVAVILSLVMVASVLAIPASALVWDTVVSDSYAYYRDPYGPTSSYKNGKFYTNLCRVPLTGDGARDTVAVALSQMGYLEGDSGYSGETAGSGNVTEYGYYMDISGYAWCAAFCSWVYYNAQVTDLYGYEDSCGNNYGTYGYWWSDTYVPNWSNQLYDFGYYRFSDYYRSSYASSQASYRPQPGDLIFFCAGYSPLDEGHIGLVVYSDDTYVYTAEGNTSSQDGVEADGGGAFFKKYALSSSSIAGYGAMPLESVSGLPTLDYSGTNPTPGLYVTTSGAVGVYLDIEDTYASWTLPMSSIFEVFDIRKDSNGYTMLYSKCEINGEEIYGWIPLGTAYNGFTRTVQIYATPDAMEPIDVVGTPFWVTHYNNIEVEGSGSIMTESYTGGTWNYHAAFSPVSGGGYEITAISDGRADGSGSPLDIPDGGFVYTLNKGNDWPAIYASDPDTYSWAAGLPDYTSDACNAMYERVGAWAVGDTFEFTNLDIESLKVPSTTPYLNWYSESYKCYSGYLLNGEEAPEVPTPDESTPDESTPDESEDTSSDNSYGATVDENGDYTFENAYGYEFALDSDGTVDGEDNIIVTPDEYDSANALWAVAVQLAPTANSGEYKVVAVGQGAGANPAFDLNADDVVLIAHSAYSNPNGANWMSKVAALALKEGDTLYVTDSGATVLMPDDNDTSVDESSSDDSNNDSSDVVDEYEVGDVNADGEIDQFDYLLVKRDYFDTYTLTADEARRADVNYDNAVDQLDYVLLKRAYFGTYTIE